MVKILSILLRLLSRVCLILILVLVLLAESFAQKDKLKLGESMELKVTRPQSDKKQEDKPVLPPPSTGQGKSEGEKVKEKK